VGDRTPNAGTPTQALVLRLTRTTPQSARPAADPAVIVKAELFDGRELLAATACEVRNVACAPIDPDELLADGVGLGLRATLAGAGDITITIEGDGDLLALDWQRAIADALPIAGRAPFRLRRRPLRGGDSRVAPAAVAGPLKILVAVATSPVHRRDVDGAMDGGHGDDGDDGERQLDVIIDALATDTPGTRAEVRVLDVANVEALRNALTRDCYHVVHLSAPMSGGLINLEGGVGTARLTDARALARAFEQAPSAIPLVVLVPDDATNDSQPLLASIALAAELATALLAGNVDRVVTIENAGGSERNIELIAALYRGLATSGTTVGAVVDLISSDRRAVASVDSETRVDGRVSLFLAGIDDVLVNDDLPDVPLREVVLDTVHPLLPPLRSDHVVGRRTETQLALRALRDDTRVIGADRRVAAVVVHGTGGIGKSTFTAGIARRMIDDGYVLAVHRGRLSLGSLGDALANGLARWRADQGRTGDAGVQTIAARLAIVRTLARRLEHVRSDEQLQRAVIDTVSTLPMLIVLDDFDDNLDAASGTFADAGVETQFSRLLARLGGSKLLIASQRRLAGYDAQLFDVPLAQLSPIDIDRLARRLPSIRELDDRDRAIIARTVGGHPGLLTLIEALLRAGEPRSSVLTRLGQLGRDERLRVAGAARQSEEAMINAMRVGARDVLLDLAVDLLDVEERRLLYACAPSNIATSVGELAIVVDRSVSAITARLRRIVDLGLATVDASIGDARDSGDHRDGADNAVDTTFASTVYVHRWMADGLRARDAAAYRGAAAWLGINRRRVGGHHLATPAATTLEALRNLLSGEAWDAAADLAIELCSSPHASSSQLFVSAVATEVLGQLPTTHRAFAKLADIEGQADIALGHTTKAIGRYEILVHLHRLTAGAHIARATAQRDLFVSCYQLGDLMLAVGRGRRAEDLHLEALTIIDRLARSEPTNADYQRDLSVSYNKLGDVMVAEGKMHEAARLYERSLTIAEQLVLDAPGDHDYRRNLAVSYNNLGDLAMAEGDRDGASALYEKSLALITELAQSGIDRTGLQRDLAVSYERLGDLARANGTIERAASLFDASYRIRKLLAERAPERADLRRDLATSYERLGDAARANADNDAAWRMHRDAFAIRQQLTEADPTRTEYWRELSISHNKLGDLLRTAQQHDAAATHYNESLAIRQRLSDGDPARADFQRDLSVSYQRLGLLAAIGAQQSDAAAYYRRGIAITEALIASEPDRVDLRCELGTKLYQLAMVLDDPGPALQRLVGILAPLEADGRLDNEASIALRAARQRLSTH